jgi:hypothetical protein
MLIPHFPALLLFAFFVSVVFGLLSKDTPGQRLLYGVKVFAAFLVFAVVLGWIMYFVPW